MASEEKLFRDKPLDGKPFDDSYRKKGPQPPKMKD